MTARETIVAALPPPGAHVRARFLVASSGLPCAAAWGNLAILCCEGKATVADGWSCAKRRKFKAV